MKNQYYYLLVLIAYIRLIATAVGNPYADVQNRFEPED